MKEGDKVSLIIGKETPLGFVVLINEEYEGLLYRDEIFTVLKLGQSIEGYIKKIRKDNKIDVTLNPQGYKNNIKLYTERLLLKLRDNKGVLYITDKSTPEIIKSELQMSKKNFKKAVGCLYKDKKIKVNSTYIELIKE